ncbi:histidine protein methyltransferase 1 homolog [Nasonia vitripennis]|uniref:protein-histidine N-methyltransferase n=1 Tax=Nasonia vitripennis TaxID=7425 RepID=A0A7M7QHP8_NASVI|nr:histidine protein methyltransferase 1 homolog [Nasonia vitripennis]
MFTFNFSKNNSSQENETDKNCDKTNQLNWLPAKEIEIPQQYFKKNHESIDYVTNSAIPDFTLKLVDSDKVVIKLTEENCENIIEAESQHSDLLPAKYEGGLKIWECTYDLANYLLTENISLRNKAVLDLGCGSGFIGLVAFLRGSTVHFQDYNSEVIESVTIPNVILNCDEHDAVKERCKFFCGDWESFANLLTKGNDDLKYDFIFTSETIYNPDNHHKLYEVFKQKLSINGIGFIAGKTYYFGVGGGMRQFEELILKDGIFDVKVVWKSDEGLQREVLKLERNTV